MAKRNTLPGTFLKKSMKQTLRCNFCHRIFNYKTNMAKLINHVKMKHADAILQFKNQDRLEKEKNSFSTLSMDETSRTSWPEVEVLQTEDAESGDKSTVEEELLDIWSLFTRTDDTFAECNLCQIRLSYRYSITNLIMHREVEHSGVLLKRDYSEDEPSRNESCDVSAEGYFSLTTQNPKSTGPKDENTTEILAKERGLKTRRSPNWQYFTKINKKYSRCKLCRQKISHTSSSNLNRHMIRKHTCELVARARNGEQQNAKQNVDDISTDALTLQPQNQSEVSDIEGGSEEESSEEIEKVRKNISDAQSSEQVSKFRRSKRMKRDHPHYKKDQMIKIKEENISMDEDQHSPLNQIRVLKVTSIADGRSRHQKGGHRGPRSFVWKFFTKLNNGCYQCKICRGIFTKNSVAGNLLRHMKRAHEDETRPYLEDETRPYLEDETYSEEQREIEESEVSRLNQLPESVRRELARTSPIIESSELEDEPTSSQTVCNLELRDERIVESRTADSGSDATGNLLTEHLVCAVEEGNHLLRNLQSAVNKQGEALNRLVACLERVNRVRKNNVNKGMNQVQKNNVNEGINQVQKINVNEGMSLLQKDSKNKGTNEVPKNDV